MSSNNMRRGRQPAGGSARGGYQQDFNGAAANQNVPQPVSGYGFTPKTPKQQAQADLIDANDVTFSVGPAGTGKTHVAIAKAVEALATGKVQRILLARPAVEAGKTIGYLPGGQNEKMAPYMRPLYDELDKAFGPGKWKKMIRDEEVNPAGVIEVAPIGTMRGRTFADTFVILDEAQNLKAEELKMALTRLGPGSKIVVTGDPFQIDLDPKKDSGLMDMIAKLDGVQNVAKHTYGPEDVMRHPTVQAIVDRLDGKNEAYQPVKKGPTP